MVDPDGVRGEELARARGHPFGETVVGFLRGRDLPAHDEEHDVQYRDALGQFREIGERGEDVGEDF